MWFEGIYRLGKAYKFFPSVKSVDEKFRRIEFPYNSSEVLSGIMLFLIIFGLIGLLLFFVLLPGIPLVGWSFLFYTFVVVFSSYVYATGIYYTQRMIDYKEEMLYALLEMSNYISLDTSIEYALIQANKNLHGVLHDQFETILGKIKNKEYKELGEGISAFIPTWLEVNPEFVKGLSLLQTASMSPPGDRDKILSEIIETIILGYYEQGKRFTEELSSQTQGLIAIGVIFPMMMLMMIPMVSVFMPDLINLPILLFTFNIFFPTLLAILAMQFAANRVQVNTIRLEFAPDFKPLPKKFFAIPLAILIVFSMPTVFHFAELMHNYSMGFFDLPKEYAWESIITIWTSSLGIFLAIEITAFAYYRKYKKLWQKIFEVEQDLPHLLQVLTTYLSLNRSIESILQDIIDDYQRHGLGRHPTTSILEEIRERLLRTKKTIYEIAKNVMSRICPSKRVASTFEKIVGFTDIDQLSAAKSSRMIREQTLSIFKLDDYIRTLLADTLSLVTAAITVLAPLLSSAAVIMSMAIVMSLQYIQDKLQKIFELFGGHIDLGLVKLEKIIPPTILEFVIGLYFLEMAVILGLFLSNIKNGTDTFKISETIMKNLLTAFVLYSILLILGYWAFRDIVFTQILKSGGFQPMSL